MAKRVLSFTKSGETFLFRYPAGLEDDVIDTVMELAEAPHCPLDWLDAATLSFQVAQYAATETNVESAPSPLDE